MSFGRISVLAIHSVLSSCAQRPQLALSNLVDPGEIVLIAHHAYHIGAAPESVVKWRSNLKNSSMQRQSRAFSNLTPELNTNRQQQFSYHEN